jgi:NTE family protein
MFKPPAENVPAHGEGVAVALSSAFLGYYTHAGFMAELHRAGVFPAQVAGTSAGALTALLCGAGLRGEAVVDFVMQRGVQSCFWDWLAPLRFPGVITSLVGSGVFSGANVIKFLRAQLGYLRLEDFHAPRVQFAIANLTQRKCTVVDRGDAIALAMASSAVPGLFCNQHIDGDYLCDGGVAMNLPFNHWLADESVHTIIVHRITHRHGTEFMARRNSLSGGLAISHHIITESFHRLRMEAAERSGKRIIEVITETAQPRLFPNGQRPGLIEAGRTSGVRAAQELIAEHVSA